MLCKNVENGHNIIPDGYNVGRDTLATAAIGDKTFLDVNYNTTEKRLTGLLPPGSQGVNHGGPCRASLTCNDCSCIYMMEGIATDGVTVLLTVTIK
jgi:hypothetical protein